MSEWIYLLLTRLFIKYNCTYGSMERAWWIYYHPISTKRELKKKKIYHLKKVFQAWSIQSHSVPSDCTEFHDMILRKVTFWYSSTLARLLQASLTRLELHYNLFIYLQVLPAIISFIAFDGTSKNRFNWTYCGTPRLRQFVILLWNGLIN